MVWLVEKNFIGKLCTYSSNPISMNEFTSFNTSSTIHSTLDIGE